MALTSYIIDVEPTSYEEAIKKQVWLDAMVEEHNSIMKNEVWDVKSRPKTSMWFPPNGYTRLNMQWMTVSKNTRQDLWHVVSLKKREQIMRRRFPE